MKNFIIIIPARFASTRLPGKMLALLAGEPLILRTWKAAMASGVRVVVATDDVRIKNCITQAGGEALMTSPHHDSGTDRLAEVVQLLGCSDEQVVINLQGDEPFMPSALLEQVANALEEHPQAGIATLCTPITTAEDFHDPNIVKVVCAQNGFAHYFSRAPIPQNRDHPQQVHGFRHLGLYAYRVAVLRRYPQLQPSLLEQCEKLEQLRALWHNIPIHVGIAQELPPPGIDSLEDLQRAEQWLRSTFSN